MPERDGIARRRFVKDAAILMLAPVGISEFSGGFWSAISSGTRDALPSILTDRRRYRRQKGREDERRPSPDYGNPCPCPHGIRVPIHRHARGSSIDAERRVRAPLPPILVEYS